MAKSNLRENFTRRTAFVFSAVTAGALAAQTQTTSAPPLKHEAPPPISAQLVKEWVGKAHQRNLDPMRELLKQEPTIIHASWDWGAGDTESAIQAAAHTGSQEMARFLIDRGARVDLFAAAMLGELTLVKTSIETFPRALSVPGAHGITLLAHAIMGDDPALPVFEYLLAKGHDVNTVHNSGLTAIGFAVSRGRLDIVKVLLAKGANPNVKALNGTTPLAISLKANKPEIAAVLRAAGATE